MKKNKKLNQKNKIKIIKKEIKELKNLILEDNEIKNLANEEINIKKKSIKKIKKNLKKIKKKEKIIIEIRIGVGGVESSLFAGDLKKMYEKFLIKMKWKGKIISESKNIMGGYKEITLLIIGKNIYKNMKYESGVHRVQRLPKTENKGRVHTSTCRVAVYKEKKNKININEKDLKIETYKSSGAGGQHVNKTNSAVRVKHLPTNIVVECQKERSQHKNKKYALKLIKHKINEYNEKNILREKRIIKRNLLGKGNRVEKIRTYNYKKNKIIDHRFKISAKLDVIMNGNLDKIIKKIKKIKNNNNLKN